MFRPDHRSTHRSVAIRPSLAALATIVLLIAGSHHGISHAQTSTPVAPNATQTELGYGPTYNPIVVTVYPVEPTETPYVVPENTNVPTSAPTSAPTVEPPVTSTFVPPTPSPVTPIETPETPQPPAATSTVASPTSTTNPPVATSTSVIAPTATPSNVASSTPVPPATTAPQPTAAPVVPAPPVTENGDPESVAPTSAPAATATAIVFAPIATATSPVRAPTQPTRQSKNAAQVIAVGSNAQSQIESPVLAVTERAILIAVSTASAGFERRGEPLGLVYTTGNRRDGNDVIFAACVANLGSQSKETVEVIFALNTNGAEITALRVPLMPGEVSARQARAIVSAIPAGKQVQIEVAVHATTALKDKDFNIAVPSAYRLTDKDPGLLCNPRDLNVAPPPASDAKFIFNGEPIRVDQAAAMLGEPESAATSSNISSIAIPSDWLTTALSIFSVALGLALVLLLLRSRR